MKENERLRDSYNSGGIQGPASQSSTELSPDDPDYEEIKAWLESLEAPNTIGGATVSRTTSTLKQNQ
jgi:hypothetical protein